jgi:nucleoid-associated protein YgaU
MSAIAALGSGASSVSAYIQCLDLPDPPINFSYNPEGYEASVNAEWDSKLQAATNGSSLQFKGVHPQEMTVKILLDTFAIPPMPPQVYIPQLEAFLRPTSASIDAKVGKAPEVMLGWGTNIIMERAVVTKLSVTFQRFLLGEPVRAEAAVTLKAVPPPTALPATNPTSGGLATLKTHTMVAGDSLASVAYKEFRNPNRWRALAEFNGIDDPMRVKPGTQLLIPDSTQASLLS